MQSDRDSRSIFDPFAKSGFEGHKIKFPILLVKMVTEWLKIYPTDSHDFDDFTSPTPPLEKSKQQVTLHPYFNVCVKTVPDVPNRRERPHCALSCRLWGRAERRCGGDLKRLLECKTTF